MAQLHEIPREGIQAVTQQQPAGCVMGSLEAVCTELSSCRGGRAGEQACSVAVCLCPALQPSHHLLCSQQAREDACRKKAQSPFVASCGVRPELLQALQQRALLPGSCGGSVTARAAFLGTLAALLGSDAEPNVCA